MYGNLRRRIQGDFKIETHPYGKIAFYSPYHISLREEEELRWQIGRTIPCGWIQHSQSNFGSPVIFVPNPNGTLRMWTDYSAVNAITMKDRYPFPHIEVLRNSIHRSCWFTKLDLAAGHHQIRIATGDRQKTAFTTKFGLYWWRDLPFGLTNGTSQLMRMIFCIFEPMKRKIMSIYHD